MRGQRSLPPLAVDPPADVTARIRANVERSLCPVRGRSLLARRVFGFGAMIATLGVIYFILPEAAHQSGHARDVFLTGVAFLAAGSLWSLGRTGSAGVSIGARAAFASAPPVVFLLIAVLSTTVFPQASGVARTGLGCFKNGVVIALVPMAILLFLWRRSDPFAPRLTGALVGGWAGLAGAVALAMACPSQSALHVLVAHGAAVAAGALAGALVGRRLLAP